MRRTARVLTLLALLASAPMVSAQAVAPKDRNAALQYATVFYTADAELFSKAGDVDMAKVGFDKARVPEEFRAAAELIRTKGEGVIGSLMEASALSRCDFELATEKGVMLLLPHLGKMRGAARLLRVDARRHLLDGDEQGAADRIAAIVRLGQHCKRDELLISSLVCLAIDTAAIEETEQCLEAGRLSASGRATIGGALSAIPTDDPFATRAAIRGEQRTFVGWMRDAFRGADAGKQILRTTSISNENFSPAERTAATAVEAMNSDQVRASVDLLNPYYDQLLAAWDKPDASARLEALSAKVSAGEFGPMGQLFGPAVTKAHDRDAQGRQRVASLLARLASK